MVVRVRIAPPQQYIPVLFFLIFFDLFLYYILFFLLHYYYYCMSAIFFIMFAGGLFPFCSKTRRLLSICIVVSTYYVAILKVFESPCHSPSSTRFASSTANVYGVVLVALITWPPSARIHLCAIYCFTLLLNQRAQILEICIIYFILFLNILCLP